MSKKASLEHVPHRFPVSIKGVILQGDAVVLLKNECDEWELPGGKLDFGEEPEDCLVREIEEEIGQTVRPGPLLDVWVYQFPDSVTVLIVTFGCLAEPFTNIVLSSEHRDSGLFPLSDLASLTMPEGYRNSVRTWLEHPDNSR